MPVDTPSSVYRHQLSALSHGIALWNPAPPKELYNKVSIGDVGYLDAGTFIRMFNVILPWNDPSNGVLGKPEPYDPLDCSPFANTVQSHFESVNYCSRFVTTEINANNVQAMRPEDLEGVTYKFRNRGALLSLPNGGYREDVIRTKVFEDYIRDHVDSWFNWARENGFGVDRMEELILVSGCTMATSWGAAACVDNTYEGEISLTSRAVSSVGASFVWGNGRHVVSHSSRFDPHNPPTLADQCVFLRGFRAKRILRVGIRVFATQKKNFGLRFGLRNPPSSAIEGSSLDTIGLSINRENPRLFPYPSSTALQSNGSVYNYSFMTSPSNDSIFEVQNYIAEEGAFSGDTTSIAHDNDFSLVGNLEPLSANAEDSENKQSLLKGLNTSFDIYQEQLSSQYPSLGLALWDPNPVEGLFKDPGHVSIGDVGYLYYGTFVRIFNVKLPRDHPSNTFIEIPEEYDPLRQEHFDNVYRSEVRQDVYHSHVDSYDINDHYYRYYEDAGKTYKCRARSHGALLSLPHGARSEDDIRTKLFQDYIRDNVTSWLRWSKKEGFPVENTEDLILVTGCTLATSWAVAAFDNIMSKNSDAAEISLEARRSDGGGVQFFWRNSRGSVEYHHCDSNNQGPENQCVFIRGFRAKRTLFGIKLIRIGSDENLQPIGSSSSSLDTIGPINHENRQRLQRIGDGSPIGGSSSTLDTIGPINHEYPQRLQRIGDGSPIGSSSSSLDTIDPGPTSRPPIDHKNSPYRHSTNGSSSLGVGPSFLGIGPSFLGLRPSFLGLGRVTKKGLRNTSSVLVGSQNESPSSTVLQSNGDLGNASFESFLTSPSDGLLIEDTAEMTSGKCLNNDDQH